MFIAGSASIHRFLFITVMGVPSIHGLQGCHCDVLLIKLVSEHVCYSVLKRSLSNRGRLRLPRASSARSLNQLVEWDSAAMRSCQRHGVAARTPSCELVCAAVRLHFHPPSPRCSSRLSLPCLPCRPLVRLLRVLVVSACVAAGLLVLGPLPPASCHPTESSAHPPARSRRAWHTSTAAATGTRGEEST